MYSINGRYMAPCGICQWAAGLSGSGGDWGAHSGSLADFMITKSLKVAADL